MYFAYNFTLLRFCYGSSMRVNDIHKSTDTLLYSSTNYFILSDLYPPILWTAWSSSLIQNWTMKTSCPIWCRYFDIGCTFDFISDYFLVLRIFWTIREKTTHSTHNWFAYYIDKLCRWHGHNWKKSYQNPATSTTLHADSCRYCDMIDEYQDIIPFQYLWRNYSDWWAIHHHQNMSPRDDTLLVTTLSHAFLVCACF